MSTTPGITLHVNNNRGITLHVNNNRGVTLKGTGARILTFTADQIAYVDLGGTFDSIGFVSDFCIVNLTAGQQTILANLFDGYSPAGGFYATWAAGSTDTTTANSNVVIIYPGGPQAQIYATPTDWAGPYPGTWNMPLVVNSLGVHF